jgi:hypothetical protein
VSRFSDEAIRAVVAKARFSEPGAAEHIANTLIKRRDKVVGHWLTGVNPLVDPRLSAEGALSFENAAAAAGVAPAASGYVITWSRFDNATGAAAGPSVETKSTSTTAMAPAAVLRDSEYVTAAVSTIHPDYPAWASAVTFTFRRAGQAWQAVGLDRIVPPRVGK